jgi:uncharacterized membrane protein YgcG
LGGDSSLIADTLSDRQCNCRLAHSCEACDPETPLFNRSRSYPQVNLGQDLVSRDWVALVFALLVVLVFFGKMAAESVLDSLQLRLSFVLYSDINSLN